MPIGAVMFGAARRGRSAVRGLGFPRGRRQVDRSQHRRSGQGRRHRPLTAHAVIELGGRPARPSRPFRLQHCAAPTQAGRARTSSHELDRPGPFPAATSRSIERRGWRRSSVRRPSNSCGCGAGRSPNATLPLTSGRSPPISTISEGGRQHNSAPIWALWSPASRNADWSLRVAIVVPRHLHHTAVPHLRAGWTQTSLALRRRATRTRST